MRIVVYVAGMNHPAVASNIRDLIRGFELNNHTVIPCYLGNMDSMVQANSMVNLHKNVQLTVGFNNAGADIASHRQECPHVTILFDEPFNINASGFSIKVPKHIVTYLDRSDDMILDYIDGQCRKLDAEYAKLPPKHKLFMPLGAFPAEEDIFSEPRPYDAVFSSSVWHIDETPPWRNGTEPTPPYIAALMDDAMLVMKQFPVSVRDAFREVLKARGMYDEEYLKKLFPHFWSVLSYVKPWRKIETVKHLVATGRDVHIIGGGTDNHSWKDYVSGDNVTFHGMIPYDEMLAVVRKSKVLVTDAAGFNDGAHDRVFIGMLNGAAVIAEYSYYLDEFFDNQREIFLYDWQNTAEHIGVIHKLIDDDNYRLSIVKSVYERAVRDCTWKSRTANILDAAAVLYGVC